MFGQALLRLCLALTLAPMPGALAQSIDTSVDLRMYLRATRVAQGLAPVPRTFGLRPPTPSPAAHTCCARHLPAEMAEMLQLECDCTLHCPHSSPQLNMV